MLRCFKLLTLLLLFSPAIGFAKGVPNGESSAFTPVPELSAGFDLLYEQKFAEARQIFANWESRNREDPFGEVAVAASYLFEELYLQGVLTSDFFLNEKKFLHGIDGRPDPERMGHFGEALTRARELAKMRQKTNPNDGEALFALTLAAGMESDAESILQKKHMNGLKRMKEANKYAKYLLANYPDANDAYIALGIANYIIGSQSAGSRFALWFDGIHGDKKLGMEQVAKTAENGRYLRPFAKIILALAARRENQAPLAQRLLRELCDQYPDSELFASEYAKVSSLPVPAMRVVIRGGRVVRMSKSITRAEFSGTYLGITTFSSEVQQRFFRSMSELISGGRVNEFFNVAVQHSADEGVMIGSTSTAGHPWAEIDDPADLAFAREHVFPRLQDAIAA